MNIKELSKGEYINENEYKFPLVKKYYSCYDKTGECYIGLFEAETDMRAIRMIEDSVNNPQAAISKHPEDYRLDKVFEIDMRKGEITRNEIRTIIEVKELKNGQGQNNTN